MKTDTEVCSVSLAVQLGVHKYHRPVLPSPMNVSLYILSLYVERLDERMFSMSMYWLSIVIISVVWCTVRSTTLEVVHCQLFGVSDDQASEGPYYCFPDVDHSAVYYRVPSPLAVAVNSGQWVQMSVVDGVAVAGSVRTIGFDGPINGRRSAVTGVRRALSVKVDAPDIDCPLSARELADDVFGLYGDPVSFALQIRDCSREQLIIVPATHSEAVDGVITVTLGMTVYNKTRESVTNAARAALLAKVGSLQNFDYVLYCIPSGTRHFGLRWLAYAFVGGKESFYNNVWSSSLSAMMHEVGHNFGLLHSGVPGKEYQDTTCMMGSSVTMDDTPRRCYNAAKTYELGWFSECHILVVDWQSSVTRRAIIGAAEYVPGSCKPASEAVTMQVKTGNAQDIFIGYNKAVGANAGTVGFAANRIAVVLAKPEGGPSTMVALLTPTREHVESTVWGPVSVRFCWERDGKAVVSVGSVVSEICAFSGTPALPSSPPPSSPSLPLPTSFVPSPSTTPVDEIGGPVYVMGTGCVLTCSRWPVLAASVSLLCIRLLYP